MVIVSQLISGPLMIFTTPAVSSQRVLKMADHTAFIPFVSVIFLAVLNLWLPPRI